MGTGSAGGGGGGGAAGAGGGSGGGSGRGIGFRFASGGGISTPDLDLDKANKEVSKTLKGLPKEYIELQFANPFLDNVYNEIFYLKQDLVTNKSWDRLERDFGIAGTGGCLSNWVGKVVALSEAVDFEQKNKVVGTVQMALEDFCIASMNDDVDAFLYGDSASVVKASTRNARFFNSIAGHFLSFLIWRVVEREKEALPPNAELKLYEACELKANSIIKAFEAEFLHTRMEEIEMITYQDMFFTFTRQLDWLIEKF